MQNNFWPLRPAVSFGLLLSPILCSTENSMFTGAPEARVLNTDPDYTSRPFTCTECNLRKIHISQCVSE